VRALEGVPSVRAIVLSGEGRCFCGGIDLSFLRARFLSLSGDATACPGELRDGFRRSIQGMQAAFSALEACRWPVLAAVHGPCVGAGVDLATACDLRFATSEATFVVKEVDLAITADLGTLQRLPALIGHGRAAELALTAAPLPAAAAAAAGLVSRVYPTREEMAAGVLALARSLAAKPALALAGTKRILLRARDRPDVADGLEHVAAYNSAILLSRDLETLVASAPRRRPGQGQGGGGPSSKL
jgi:enoyl-CoA hydratase/carnithine racemase